jgi:hypothetical protein
MKAATPASVAPATSKKAFDLIGTSRAVSIPFVRLQQLTSLPPAGTRVAQSPKTVASAHVGGCSIFARTRNTYLIHVTHGAVIEGDDRADQNDQPRNITGQAKIKQCKIPTLRDEARRVGDAY